MCWNGEPKAREFKNENTQKGFSLIWTDKSGKIAVCVCVYFLNSLFFYVDTIKSWKGIPSNI